MPAAASHSISRKKLWSGGTSAKLGRCGLEEAGEPRKRCRKAAIWPRVTGAAGRKEPSGKPWVMPRATSQSMSAANGCVDGTSGKRVTRHPPDPCCRPAAPPA